MSVPRVFRFGLLFLALFAFSAVPAEAKDEWLQIRSKNFLLVGNASEKDIRKVATKLEQFRESFRLLFGVNLSSAVPTTVVVFKSAASYKPFKPKREDGRIDTNVAGYFQSGEDVNYITLSTEGTDADTFGTIYHEYVHFLLDASFGKSEIPPWFNEGLAEYYQTFSIEEDQNLKLGMHQDNHILLLRQNQLIPLATFFNINNYSLRQNGNHSKSIFYAQAWALIHYLTLNGKSDGLKKFLAATMANKPAEQAFQEAFGIGYAAMEKELRKYVGQGSFKYMYVPLKTKLVFDAEMQVSPLDAAKSNAYLGDLLYHTHRYDDAEPFLRTALSLDPDLSMANTTLGMVRIEQRKYDEAKTFLDKAIAQDQRNHLALYRLAYLLSREGRDEFGFVQKFDPASASRMRDLLKKAIALKPTFTASYELLAFINLVNNEELDDAVAQLHNALKHHPGESRYHMRIAEIYLRQNKFKDAGAIAEKIARTADDPELRSRAEELTRQIREREELTARYETLKGNQERAASGPGVGEPILVRRRPGEENPTPEQIAAARQEAEIRGINHSLRPPKPGDVRVLGQITKIDCSKGNVVYSVKTGTETFLLSSKDFQGLEIITFVPDSEADFGCKSDLANSTVVLTYRPQETARPPVRGELIVVELVPKHFRFIDPASEPKPPTYVVEETGPSPSTGDAAEQRRNAMFQALRQTLRSPAAGEKRELGFIERTECSSKGMFFYIKVGQQVLRLSNISASSLAMRAFTPDVENLQIGCGMKAVDIPVVFIFRETVDLKNKTNGDLISLEFVPKNFTLN